MLMWGVSFMSPIKMKNNPSRMERLLRTMEPIRWVFWALLVTAADAGPAVVVVIFAVVGFGDFFEMVYLAIFRMLRDSET